PGAATHVSLSVARPAGGPGDGQGDRQTDGQREGPGGERLTVLVVNEPPPEPPAGPLEVGGTGHGLVGMRERVRLVGGTLDVGPLPDGGFRVAAQLPLTEEDIT
ncbi:sensor histidine kinase, partial [Streptomyces anthocyanicus]